MRNIKIYFKDILLAIDTVQEFIKGMDKEEFKNDLKTKQSIYFNLEIIGEAIKKIPKEFKDNYQDIPWKKIAGMRDRIIHFYWGIDDNMIWDAITINLPEIRPKIQEILLKLEKDAR